MSNVRRAIEADGAPAAIGPYSQAVISGGFLFCSGQIPLDAASGELVGETVGEQTTQCLDNLAAVCAEAGTSLERALRLTVYTIQLARFDEINEAYAAFFGQFPPARVAVGVESLPKGALVEVDAIVEVG